jgi:tol-pal system protein YbgF
MKHLAGIVIISVAAFGLPAPVAAQNRAETQLLLEMRVLQEQVQKMQLTVNQLSEKLKTTDSRLDTQANDSRKGFADQKLLIDSISAGLRTLNERENEGSVRIAQFSQELRAIREGLTSQQSTLAEIANLLQPLSAAAFAAAAATSTTDPAAGASPPGTATASGPPLSKPPVIPPNPTAYYGTAFGYYYAGQWELAVTALAAAIQKFPEHPEAPHAQFAIGESYFQWGKHFQEALTAYTAVVTNYKDPQVVSDALYKQGMTYEQLGQKDAAIKSYQQVIKLYKGTSAATQAETALRRLIKQPTA